MNHLRLKHGEEDMIVRWLHVMISTAKWLVVGFYLNCTCLDRCVGEIEDGFLIFKSLKID